jgi:hypothetical protein
MTSTLNGTWQTVTTGNSGLSADHVTDIAEDAAGNLWFATYGGGLCRQSADGRDWQVYRAGAGALVNDYVGLVTVDVAGRVWVVCDAREVDDTEYPGGMCVLSPDGTWQVYPRAVDEDCIRSFESDRNGTLWFRIGGSVSGRVTQCDGMREGEDRFRASKWQAFDGTTWTTYDTERAAIAAWYPHRPARTRTWELANDTVWLLEATQLFEPPVVAPAPPQPAPAGQADQGTETGSPPPLTGLEEVTAALNRMAQMMRFTPGLGSFLYDYCLATYDGQEWKKQTTIPTGFRFGELAVDARGHKWVSLFQLGDIVLGGGVGRFDGTEWTVFNEGTGLSGDYVVAISTDSRGNVWLSLSMGNLRRWDGLRWTQFPGGQDGRGDQDLGRCVEDRQGRLWFPSRAGAVVYTPRR